MKIRSFVLMVLVFVTLGHARGDPGPVTETNGIENNDTSTSMNGNTSTNSGMPISSTSASRESRSVSGNGD